MPLTDADTKTQRLLELQMLFWRSIAPPEATTFVADLWYHSYRTSGKEDRQWVNPK